MCTYGPSSCLCLENKIDRVLFVSAANFFNLVTFNSKAKHLLHSSKYISVKSLRTLANLVQMLPQILELEVSEHWCCAEKLLFKKHNSTVKIFKFGEMLWNKCVHSLTFLQLICILVRFRLCYRVVPTHPNFLVLTAGENDIFFTQTPVLLQQRELHLVSFFILKYNNSLRLNS